MFHSFKNPEINYRKLHTKLLQKELLKIYKKKMFIKKKQYNIEVLLCLKFCIKNDNVNIT